MPGLLRVLIVKKNTTPPTYCALLPGNNLPEWEGSSEKDVLVSSRDMHDFGFYTAEQIHEFSKKGYLAILEIPNNVLIYNFPGKRPIKYFPLDATSEVISFANKFLEFSQVFK